MVQYWTERGPASLELPTNGHHAADSQSRRTPRYRELEVPWALLEVVLLFEPWVLAVQLLGLLAHPLEKLAFRYLRLYVRQT